eukprot:1101053-Lingulodinium_polyedra.AAC.1
MAPTAPSCNPNYSARGARARNNSKSALLRHTPARVEPRATAVLAVAHAVACRPDRPDRQRRPRHAH